MGIPSDTIKLLCITNYKSTSRASLHPVSGLVLLYIFVYWLACY